jgi:glucan phosphoethanolaminetransferase (alkaline phosphatase superfamily)
MDLLIHIKDFWINLVNDMPHSLLCFILRMGILLILSAFFLFWAWKRFPHRSVFSQTCVAFMALVIALYIPVDKFRETGKGFLTFVATIALLCMIFLPSWLPFWLTPRLGNQLKLKKVIMGIVWGLFLVQLLTAYAK